MFPPNPLSFRHFPAKRHCAAQNGFASTRLARQAVDVGLCLPWQFPQSHTCYPSPSERSGPSLAGSHSSHNRRVNADAVRRVNFPFESVGFALDSRAIKITTRGSKPCRNRLSSSLFSPFRSRPACRTRRRAALPALLPAPLSPMRWTKTWSPAQPWVRLPVRQPAVSKSVCRPASRATDLIRAFRRANLNHGVVWANRPVGPFAFSRLAARAD